MLSPTRRATDSFDRCVGTPSRVQVRRDVILEMAFAVLDWTYFSYVIRFARVPGSGRRRRMVTSGGAWRSGGTTIGVPRAFFGWAD